MLHLQCTKMEVKMVTYYRNAGFFLLILVCSRLICNLQIAINISKLAIALENFTLLRNLWIFHIFQNVF